MRTSPQQQVSVTLLQNWQESLSVTCRLWMWTTGIHSNSESVESYSSPNVNRNIKNMLKELSHVTISLLPVIFIHVLVTIKAALF